MQIFSETFAKHLAKFAQTFPDMFGDLRLSGLADTGHFTQSQLVYQSTIWQNEEPAERDQLAAYSIELSCIRVQATGKRSIIQTDSVASLVHHEDEFQIQTGNIKIEVLRTLQGAIRIAFEPRAKRTH